METENLEFVKKFREDAEKYIQNVFSQEVDYAVTHSENITLAKTAIHTTEYLSEVLNDSLTERQKEIFMSSENILDEMFQTHDLYEEPINILDVNEVIQLCKDTAEILEKYSTKEKIPLPKQDCRMKEIQNWMGIEGVEYRYYNEWADPTVTYKGFTFSEWELTDAVQDWIDYDVQQGDIPVGTTIQEYLQNENNHVVVTDILDDFVATRWEILRAEATMKLENTIINLLDFKEISFEYFRDEVSEEEPSIITTYSFMGDIPMATQEEYHSEAFEQWDLQDSDAEGYSKKDSISLTRAFQKIHDSLEYAMNDFNKTKVFLTKENGTKLTLQKLLHPEEKQKSEQDKQSLN